MKKVLPLIVLMLTIGLVLTGCGNDVIPKTEYTINETAKIDDITLKLEKASYTPDNKLELVFDITNNRDNTLTLSPDDYFVLYDINKVQIPNVFSNNTNIIKKNSSLKYTLQYNVDNKELYEIYFYSGIVENNIKFTVTGLDIDKTEQNASDEVK